TPTNPGEHYTGVLILRRANLPVDKGSVPTDTTSPALCSTVGTGIVVFNNTAGATSFTDNSTDTCGAPANGTTYFYKVFLRDNLNYYSTQPIANGSTFTEEIDATPNTAAATQKVASWINATYSTNLAAPSLFPGSVVMLGAGTNLIFGIDPNTGLRKYLPLSLGGPVNSRSPVIDAPDSTLNQNVIYVGDADGLVYGIATDTGQILWAVNPTGVTTNNFQGAPSVELKAINSALTDDIVVLGTDNGATTSANQILGIDANTGANAWTPIVGNAGGVLPMDIITSTPLVDYVNNAVWVTSHSACGTAQPSLWKLKTTTPGGVLLTRNLGDMDVSPVLTFPSDVLFVATGGYALNGTGQCVTGNSTLYAINPVTGATVNTFAPSPVDGAIVGFPLVLGFSSPYTIIFSGNAQVHAVSYNKAANTFTTLWTVNVAGPGAPIGYTNFGKVYVGSSDGFIHQIDIASGVDDFDEYVNTVNTGSPAVIGDASLDLNLSRVYISTTDQRSYAFPFPF
ncbi:MAG: PQQ-binding-like beta-propeller repeat protein, partial [Candidatus Acidiferrales bacterium]